MKRKFFSVLLTAAFTAAAVAGCKQNVGTPEDNAVVEETDEDEDQDEETRVFGFSSTDMSNPFYETIQESVRTTLEEQGDRLIVTDPKSDVNKQISQIRDMIESGVDAVFLCPADEEKITPALEALDEAGIPVVNLDIRVSESDLTEAFIGSDNTNAGYVCGEDLISRRPGVSKAVPAYSPSPVPTSYLFWSVKCGPLWHSAHPAFSNTCLPFSAAAVGFPCCKCGLGSGVCDLR